MYCSKCGKEIAEDTKFCGQCGAAQEDSAPTQISQPAQYIVRRKKRIKIARIIVVVAVIVAIICFVGTYAGKKTCVYEYSEGGTSEEITVEYHDDSQKTVTDIIIKMTASGQFINEEYADYDEAKDDIEEVVRELKSELSESGLDSNVHVEYTETDSEGLELSMTMTELDSENAALVTYVKEYFNITSMGENICFDDLEKSIMAEGFTRKE